MAWVNMARWERRDAASRDDLAAAMIEVCRATRGASGVTDCRFYWASTDELVMLTFADEPSLPLSSDVLTAELALGDLARPQGVEWWADATFGPATDDA